MPVLTVNGVTLNTVDEGSGDVIVFTLLASFFRNVGERD